MTLDTNDLAARRELAHLRRRWARAMRRTLPRNGDRLLRLAQRWIAALEQEAQALEGEEVTL